MTYQAGRATETYLGKRNRSKKRAYERLSTSELRQHGLSSARLEEYSPKTSNNLNNRRFLFLTHTVETLVHMPVGE